MKREGGGEPWTSPQPCKRSRLCVSTAGSPKGHLRLVLHFRRRSSSLTQSNCMETACKNGEKPCVDERINGKIVKTPRVGTKDSIVGHTKKRPAQQKLAQDLEMNCRKSDGNEMKPCVDKVTDRKVSESSTLMRKEERTSHTKKKQEESGQDLETNCRKSSESYRLEDLDGTNSSDSDLTHQHCRQSGSVEETCRETIPKREVRNCTSKDLGRSKVKYNGYQSHKYFTPLFLKTGTVTKPGIRAKRTPNPNPCHKVMHHNAGQCTEPLEKNGVCTIESNQKPLLQKKHVCVGAAVEDSRHSKWYVSPISGTRHVGKQLRRLEEKRCNREVKLATAKTMSETDAQKVPRNKQAILAAESRTASQIEEGLFPTCPWEEDNQADIHVDFPSEKIHPDPGRKETQEKLKKEGNKEQTVSNNSQLSKVHEPARKSQSGVCERTINSEVHVHHRNTSCTNAEVTLSPTAGATRQKNIVVETGRSEKENFVKEGQDKYAGKSPERVSASLHGQHRPLKDTCKKENIVEMLQCKLVIAKDLDNTKDFNGPIKSADTSDIIDDVIKHRQPIKKDLGNKSGGNIQNGPITVRNGSSEETPEDVGTVKVGMKQATAPVNSPRKLDLEVADLMTLAHDRWLNDNVLNGYFELLAEVRPDDVYCFNTFFYSQLCRKGYQGVRRWTKKVQIFQKSLLLVPLHLGNHWCLAEVAVQDKLLYLYDSQGGANLTCLQRLVSYLCCEAEEHGEADFTSGWDGHCKEGIPMQETSSDCGVYVCQYARCIVEGRPIDFRQEDIPEFRCHMTQELLKHKLL